MANSNNEHLKHSIEQVKSRKRVADHGEVFTSKREVNAMLDLVKQETERIESRFLEPACGNGNFLAEILRRKLDVVNKRYAKNQFDYERNAVVAVSSIYGIDILEDNVKECRQRLASIFIDEYYKALYAGDCKVACIESVEYILSCNIVWGDALTLKTVGEQPGNIVFAEWSPINGSLIKRRDFTFGELMSKANLRDEKDITIFDNEDTVIPTPIKDYPPIHFLEIGLETRSVVETSSRRFIVEMASSRFSVQTTSCRLHKEKLQDEASTQTRQDDVSTIKLQDEAPSTEDELL